MTTAMFLMGVFGVMGLLIWKGMSMQSSTKRKGELSTEDVVVIIGLVFCFLWLITGLIVIYLV